MDYSPFTYTYPTYNDGWEVTAYPDGRLINKADGTEHYYLFWEGGARPIWEFESGFVVKGSDTEAFLREKLAYLGLTPREYNDFITYWVPKMQNSPYNLITFAEEQYEELAPLTVTPKPDSVVRSMRSWPPSPSPPSRTVWYGYTWSICRWNSPLRSPSKSSPRWSAPASPLWSGAEPMPAI